MGRGYGFIDGGSSDRVYAVTSDYDDIARNHCAATMMVNLMLRCYAQDPMCRDRRELFLGIHRIVGNGPILFLPRRANRYLASRGVPMACGQVCRRLTETRPDRLSDLAQRELAAGNACALLVAESLLNWHWVLAVSVKIRPSGTAAFCIVDGWHARRVFYYIPDQGSRLLAIAVFHE